MVYYVIKPASVVTGTAKDLASCKVTLYTSNASLADLQKHVGGHIESYPIDYGKDVECLYVNEEGHPCCLGLLPRNRIAEKFIRAYTYALYSEFLVYGPMVVDCADNQKSRKRIADIFVEINEDVAFDKVDEERVKCKGRYPSAPVHDKAFTATATMIGGSTLRIDDIDHLDFWLEVDIFDLVKRAGWVET